MSRNLSCGSRRTLASLAFLNKFALNTPVGTFCLLLPLTSEEWRLPRCGKCQEKTNMKIESIMKTKTQLLRELNVPDRRNNQTGALEIAREFTKTDAMLGGRKLGRRSFVKSLALGATAILPVN